MVLWEMTLATAYFLGLKRTYRLALRIQRRLIGPNHPKLRHFVHRRIRSVFDVAVSVHLKIQQRDIEVGRNLGNSILRWLDHMKPSAQIRGPPTTPPTSTNDIPRHVRSSARQPGTPKPGVKIVEQEKKGRLLFTPLNIQTKPLPNIAMMMQLMKPAGMNGGQHRRISYNAPYASAVDYRMGRADSVFRKDIAQWMLHH